MADVQAYLGYREQEYRRQIDQLSQSDLATVLCCAVAAIDDEHLRQTLKQMSDDDLGTLVASGIVEQREREKANGFYGFDAERERNVEMSREAYKRHQQMLAETDEG